MSSLMAGFLFIFIAAVAGGAFGLQYRVMRRYDVENASLLSIFFATVPIPLLACYVLLPGWPGALVRAGFGACAWVFTFGFCWGLGAITYAYAFNILGMALAASLLKGISIGIGSGIPLVRHWPQIPAHARTLTIVGLGVLIIGTAIAGVAGMMREREMRNSAGAPRGGAPETHRVKQPTGRLFWLGVLMCLLSGVASAGANIGYDRADVIERAMGELAPGQQLHWKATLIRWMPMYWGGITALLVFMGGTMIRRRTWRHYFAPGSRRDFLIASTMGGVHFLAQIPYGIGAFYLGKLGTTVGWGVNIGMALIVATSLGFLTGEWRGTTPKTFRTLLAGIVVLLAAMGLLAYANSLA